MTRVECNLLKTKIKAFTKYKLKMEARLELNNMAYYTNNTATTVQLEYLEKTLIIGIYEILICLMLLLKN